MSASRGTDFFSSIIFTCAANIFSCLKFSKLTGSSLKLRTSTFHNHCLKSPFTISPQQRKLSIKSIWDLPPFICHTYLIFDQPTKRENLQWKHSLWLIPGSVPQSEQIPWISPNRGYLNRLSLLQLQTERWNRGEDKSREEGLTSDCELLT